MGQRLPSVDRIISGGQTGVDRGALRAAIAAGLRHGGWCPRGRRAEDGQVPLEFQLIETPSSAYSQRTERNVRLADATLIVARGALAGGTLLTRQLADRYAKPCRIVDITAPEALAETGDWLTRIGVRTLNVAGPRESEAPGIEAAACEWLRRLLTHSSYAGE